MLFNIAFGDDNWLWRGIPGVFSPWRCLLDPSWELQAFADVRATIDEATLMIWLKLYMPHQEVFARHRWNEREILLHSFFFSSNGLGHFKWPLTFSREPVLPHVKLVADWWNTADSTHQADRIQLCFHPCYVRSDLGKLLRHSTGSPKIQGSQRAQHFLCLFKHQNYWCRLAWIHSNVCIQTHPTSIFLWP